MMTEVAKTIAMERTMATLRSRLGMLKYASLEKNVAERRYQEVANLVKDILREVDGENGNGVRFTLDGGEYAAILSKPTPELSWDAEKLVPYLQEIGVWERVSTQVVDPYKLASELAAGTLVLTDEQKAEFQVLSKDVAASVRFVNPTPQSI